MIDVLLLLVFRAAAQQENDLTILDRIIDAKARPKIDLHFEDTITNRFYVPKVA